VNPLAECGLPRFFAVAGRSAARFAIWRPRYEIRFFDGRLDPLKPAYTCPP
jgi:hypothetical protein